MTTSETRSLARADQKKQVLLAGPAVQRRSLAGLVPALPAMLWIVGCVILPMALMGVYSFWSYRNFDIFPEWTLENYRSFFTQPMYPVVLARTVVVAVVTTAASIVLAYPFAYFLAGGTQRWTLALLILVMVPYWTSHLIRTYSWMSILGEQGVINSALIWLGVVRQPVALLFTPVAVVIAAIYLYLPFAILALYSALEKISPSLREAARDLGARPWQVFRLVTLPLSVAGLQAAVIFIFIPTLGLYVTPALLGGAQGTLIGNLLVPIFKEILNFAHGSALTFIVLALVLLALVLAGRSLDLERLYAGGVGAATAARTSHPGLFLPFRLYALVVYLFLFAPIVVLVMFSFDASQAASFPLQGFTLQWYGEAMADSLMMRSVGNSLLIATIAALVAVAVAAPAAFATARYRFPGRSMLKHLVVIPMVVPSIMLAFGLLSLFVRLGIDLSVATVVMGHVTYVLPYVFLVILAQQYGFDRSLEEAARDLGANTWATFWRITLPLMVPGLLAGALFAFTLSLDEFIIAFLLTGTTTTLPMYVWGMLRGLTSPTVNALGTMIVVVALVTILAGNAPKLLRRRAES